VVCAGPRHGAVSVSLVSPPAGGALRSPASWVGEIEGRLKRPWRSAVDPPRALGVDGSVARLCSPVQRLACCSVIAPRGGLQFSCQCDRRPKPFSPVGDQYSPSCISLKSYLTNIKHGTIYSGARAKEHHKIWGAEDQRR